MKFVNMAQHKSFWRIKEQIPPDLKGDRELLSIAYIMASSRELEKKITPYIKWNDGFDYEKMFANEEFVQAEKVLVKLAVVLYDNGVDLQFKEVFSELNQDQREVALNAANYRFAIKDIYDPQEEKFYTS